MGTKFSKLIMSISSSAAVMIYNNRDFVKSNDDKFKNKDAALHLAHGMPSARVAIVTRAYSAYQSSDDPELIQKLFSALKLDLNDVCIIDYDNQQAKSWKHIGPLLEAEYVLLFGLIPKDLGLNLRVFKNKWFPFSGKHLIFTDDLYEMVTDKQMKIPFWNALKPVFLS